MTEKFNEAIEFALEKHKNQRRKMAPLPYFVHLYEVAQILKRERADEETLIGAYLHDVVEDTGTSLQEVREKFGDRVATLVDYCSEIKGLPYLERKAEHAKRLAKAPLKAKMIKCADSLSNLRATYFDTLYYDDPWGKFNSTKDNIHQHYAWTLQALKELKDTKMYRELKYYYDLTFGSASAKDHTQQDDNEDEKFD